MTITKRVFYVTEGMCTFFKRKSVQNSLLLVLAFFFTLGFVFNAEAVQIYDPKEIYEEVDVFSSASTATPGRHSHKAQGFQLVDSTTNLLDLVYPQGNANYQAILDDPNISPGAKLGLIGAIDAPVSALLMNPPYIDIGGHLAQEWIPNYSEYNTSVYASSGYERLQSSGITILWQYTRNIAYIMFVIVFIIAGFMIMFRHKLGGQTMVTIYNTLPNIIIGLVLVTFSYAIVGFIIDIGAVLIRIISSFLNIQLTLGGTSVDGATPLKVWSTYSYEVGAEMMTGYTVIGDFTESFWGNAGAILNLVLGGLIGALVSIVLSVVIAFASIKIFITLVKAYVGILMDTVLAPIVLAVATIPGKQGLTKDWINRVLKNVMTFVLVFLLINLPIYLMQNNFRFDLFGGNLVADVSDRDVTDTGMSAFFPNLIMAAIAIYMLFLASNVPTMLADYFPQTGGKSMGDANKGVMSGLSKTPGVGGFFKS